MAGQHARWVWGDTGVALAMGAPPGGPLLLACPPTRPPTYHATNTTPSRPLAFSLSSSLPKGPVPKLSLPDSVPFG
eukprot:15433626-Alexandrium_andersonii.AAC.1